MNRRKSIALGVAAATGWAASECLPRWAWSRSVARGTDDYSNTIDFVADWTDAEGIESQQLEIEPEQVSGLAYHRASRNRLKVGASESMELLYLEYEAGNPHYFEDLFYHPPERCMAAEGKVIASRHRYTTVEKTEVETRCVTFREHRSQRLIHVYKAVWLHQSFPVRMGSGLHWRKVQSAMAFKPCPPARMLMAAVLGSPDEATAWEQFRSIALSQLRSTQAQG